jgi:peptidyl-dipeptidase A
MTGRTLSLLSIAAACAAALSCSNGATSAASASAADATRFLDTANDTTLKVGIEASRAGWVQQTYITDDTEALAARANQLANEAGARFAKEATKYDKVDVPADQRRQLTLLKTSLVLATPSDPKESDELSKIMARLESTYGKGKWCTDPAKPDTCRNIDEVTKIMASSRDAGALRAAWEGWHTIAPPMKKDYQRFVELSNKGARELGFADTGAMWRSKYDMPPDGFTKELDRLWGQVRPLYVKLHAYTRLKLRDK